MKTGQVVEYIVLIGVVTGALLTILKAWKDYLKSRVDIAREESGKSSAMVDLLHRMDRFDERLEGVERNEERYLNLLEKMANRFDNKN